MKVKAYKLDDKCPITVRWILAQIKSARKSNFFPEEMSLWLMLIYMKYGPASNFTLRMTERRSGMGEYTLPNAAGE